MIAARLAMVWACFTSESVKRTPNLASTWTAISIASNESIPASGNGVSRPRDSGSSSASSATKSRRSASTAVMRLPTVRCDPAGRLARARTLLGRVRLRAPHWRWARGGHRRVGTTRLRRWVVPRGLERCSTTALPRQARVGAVRPPGRERPGWCRGAAPAGRLPSTRLRPREARPALRSWCPPATGWRSSRSATTGNPRAQRPTTTGARPGAHGRRPIPRAAYRGLRAGHLSSLAAEPVGCLLSLTCWTASRWRVGTSFAEQVVLLGAAAASMGAVRPVLHLDTTRVVLGLAAALHQRAPDVATLLSSTFLDLEGLPTAEAGLFRLCGDPLAPTASEEHAAERARAVFAPAPDVRPGPNELWAAS